MSIAERRRNPYCDVDWQKVHRVQGCTHMHTTCAETLDIAIRGGLEFATLSNYYPSAPYYPLRSIYENTFKMGQGGYIKDGKLYREAIDYRKMLESLGEDASCVPTTPGKRLFNDPPAGFMEAPNAEHAWFSDYNVYLHICAVGSMLTTSFCREPAILKAFEKHGFTLGCKIPWREAFRAMLDELIVPDGGGITINHPNWSHLPVSHINEMLDFDPRVLGIEIYSDDSDEQYSGQAEPVWDAVLGTGRQCYGFCVQDHIKTRWFGRSVLLVDERTPEACLRAYRQGRFYGAVRGEGLTFEYIHFDGRTLRARTDDPKTLFQLMSREGVAKEEYCAQEIEFTVPDSERAKHGFLRLSAYSDRTKEKLYAQAFMLD